MNEFVEQFLLESRELLVQATNDLLAFEQRTADPEKIDSVFRAFHTLKGAAGIVEFAPMGRALHAGESVLAEIRSKATSISPDVIDKCLACLDQITKWLDAMETTGEAPTDAGPAADVIVRRFAGAITVDTFPVVTPHDVDWLGGLRDRHADHFSKARTALRYVPDAEAFFRGEDPLARIEKLPGLLALDLLAREPAQPFDAINPFTCAMDITALASANAETITGLFGDASDQIEIYPLDTDGLPTSDLSPLAKSILQTQILLLQDSERAGRVGRALAAGRVAANVLRHAGAAEAAAVVDVAFNNVQGGDGRELVAAIEHALRETPTDALIDESDATRTPSPMTVRVLRVDTARIDTLVNLTGELTVVKNALGHLATLARGGLDAKALAAGLRDQQGQLDRLVGELQRAVLRIRVLPMRQVFQRFPRLVREISSAVGKPTRFQIEGDDTEADTAIVESLFEPLLHVLRNAVDHGVEQVERRAARGKPATATITLRASRYLDSVIVEIEDDGGGVDVNRVRDVAASRGMMAPDVLAAMADSDVVNLIFAAGFSTATEVTGLSGRGVGMDAVRASVERLSGRVSIESRPNLGTTVRLTLPFTMMMTRVMTIEAGGQVFGLPLSLVVETAMIARDRIVPIGAAKAFAWRDKTVPLLDLAETLALPGKQQAAGQARVVITSADGQLGALEVDRLGERMDVMLKPMDGLLGGMRGVAGTTLLGDGRVLIVLDVQELFN